MQKLQSHTITQGKNRAGARSMLKAIGFTDEDLAKPIIGIANTWIETMPCNFNLRELAIHVKAGIQLAGGTPMEFNTIAISDGVTMGTEGMKASLVSREVIADSIELLVRGHMFDGIVALVACDKTTPGAAMAALRVNVPTVVLYGGSIMPGEYKGRAISIQDVYEAIGANAAGKISDEELREIEKSRLPRRWSLWRSSLAANTMAIVMELIGLSPMGTASVPQPDKRKEKIAYRCGQVIMDAVRNNLRPAIFARAKRSTMPSPAWLSPAGLPMRAALAPRSGGELKCPVHRRFRAHLRAHAGAGRSQTQRTIYGGRCGYRRRHPPHRATPARR